MHKILIFKRYTAPDAVIRFSSNKRREKLLLAVHEESQRCPICCCRFQTSTFNHPKLSDVSHRGRVRSSYTTWALQFFFFVAACTLSKKPVILLACWNKTCWFLISAFWTLSLHTQPRLPQNVSGPAQVFHNATEHSTCYAMQERNKKMFL